MENVGKYLKIEALSLTDKVQRDMFGRSAFNRYYYAIYYDVKSILGMIDPKWYGLAHGAFPDILRGSVCKKIKAVQTTAYKTDDIPLIKLCQRTLSASHTIAGIMESGYAVRVTADYYSHNIRVEFDKKSFQLNKVSIDDIESSLYKAQGLLSTIRTFFQSYG